MGLEGLAPSVSFLLAGLLLDAVFGDPQVRFHPIRLMGDSLTLFERLLRRLGMDGYAGGCTLFLMLSALWVALPCFAIYELSRWSPTPGWIAHVLVVFILFSMRDLIDHVRAGRCGLPHMPEPERTRDLAVAEGMPHFARSAASDMLVNSLLLEDRFESTADAAHSFRRA